MDQPEQSLPVIVTITGPSGSGKTVLSQILHDQGMKALVSTTTRSPRQGEVHGRDYYFLTPEEFNEKVTQNRFIEHVVYNGVSYGVSVDEANKAFSMNKPAVLVAEPHGVEQIALAAHNRGWEVLRVFVDNPEEVLLGRLLYRLLSDVTGVDARDDGTVRFNSWIKLLNNTEDKTRITEILSAFVQEQKENIIVSDVDVKIEATAHRLKSFQYEQQNWVVPARTNAQLYDYICDSFDENVQNQVVQDVLQRVDVLQSNEKKNNAGFRI